jgi:beta-galactosidase
MSFRSPAPSYTDSAGWTVGGIGWYRKTPGELKAVACENGEEIGNVTFATAGKAHKLALNPDRSKLKASRDDLSYVMVQVLDEHGRPLPDAVVPVTFAVNGAGEIAAVGNANPKDVEASASPTETPSTVRAC